VRAYVERHAFATRPSPTCSPSSSAPAARPARWSRAWLQTSASAPCGPSSTAASARRQESDVLRPHRTGVGAYDRVGDALVLRERLDVEITGERAVLAVDPLPDLLLPNDGDLTFAKVRFDDRSLATVLADVRRLADPLARALSWAALWDACRDAELPAAAFVRAVLGGVDGETDPAVVATLLTQARTAATLYAADPAGLLDELAGRTCRRRRRRRPAATCSSRGCGPSPRRRGGGRTPPRSPRCSTGRGCRPGSSSTPSCGGTSSSASPRSGRSTTLRWTPSSRVTTPPPAACTPTPRGPRCRRPRRSGAPGRTRRGRACRTPRRGRSPRASGGPAQDDVLRPWVQRYVDELPALWDARTPQVAGTLALDLFPSTLVEQDVHDRTAVLEHDSHPAGLRRFVAEGRDDLARALRARAAARR
jgi:aminopeptidase N